MTNRFNRILVVGRPGAGKTVFSDRLGKLTGRKITHLDNHIWGPNWKELQGKKELRRKKIEELTSTEQWVLDGHYLDDIEHRLERADTVVFFDIPIWRSYYGFIRRSISGIGNLYRDKPDQNFHATKKLRRAVFERKFRKTISNYDVELIRKLIREKKGKDVYLVHDYISANKTLELIVEKIDKSKS